MLRFLARNKRHIFPVVLIIVVVVLSFFRISGTSIGVYHDKFYGKDTPNDSLILGHPRDVRSDEFLVITQLTIMQAVNDFSMVNPYQNQGKDVSVLLDVPYLEWSTIFKPQNFSFYLLPLENAFAFKWWAMLSALLISAYYFFLRILGRRHILIAIMGSFLIGLSPFVFWWYQAGTIMTLAYGFIIMLLSVYFIDLWKNKPFNTKSSLLKAIAVSTLLMYTLVCFALNIYPPFQIPVALVTSAFILGYLLTVTGYNLKKIISFAIPFFLIVSVALGVLAIFLVTRQSTVDAISNTVYPGKRTVPSGKNYYSPHLLTSYLQPQLQREDRGYGYIINQSESSTFIITSVITFVPSIYLIYLGFRRRQSDAILISTTLLNVVFLSHILLPMPAIFAKLSLLSTVPQQRLIIGLGFLGILQLMYIASLMLKSKQMLFSKKFTLIFVICLSLLSLIAGVFTVHDYPKFISQLWLVLILLIPFLVGIYLFFSNHLKQALVVLGIFSVMSIAFIHPLYQGLSPVYQNKVSQTIKDISPSNSTWGVVDGTLINNLPQMAKRNTISGIEFYPNTKYWQAILGQKYNNVYNRYAHVTFSDHPYDVVLMQNDLYMVSIQCNKRLVNDLDYILSPKELNLPCMSYVKDIHYPNAQYFIYKVSP